MEPGFGERVISSASECRAVLPAADYGRSCQWPKKGYSSFDIEKALYDVHYKHQIRAPHMAHIVHTG